MTGWHTNGNMDSVTAVDDRIVAEALGIRVRFHTTQPPKVELEMPLKDAPGWRLGLLVLVHEGSLVIAEVKVFPDGDRRDPVVARRHEWANEPRQWSEDVAALAETAVPTITARMLRSIRLGEILTTLRTELETKRHTAIEHGVWDEILGLQPSTLGEAFADVLSHPASRARQGDEYFARLAQRYAEVVAAGSRHPIPDLASELGVKPSHVRDAIFPRREKGYLSRSLGRRSGGSLTPAGRDVLQKASRASSKSPAVRPRRGATASSPFAQAADEGECKR